MKNERRLKVLFIPAWYPSEVSQVGGTFVREHATAASLHNDVVVLYAYGDSSPSLKLWRISESMEDGVRTVRVRYGGVLSYLWRRGRSKEHGQQSPGDSRGKLTAKLVKVLGFPKTVVADLLCYLSLLVAFRRLVRGGWRPDIIHAHVFTAGVPAVVLGKLYRVLVVITEHWTVFPRLALGPVDRRRLRFAVNRAEMVLPVSNALKEAIETYGIRTRFRIVPNVVNTEVFCPIASADGSNEDGVKKLLLVGVLSPQKGVPYLLEALSQIRLQRSNSRLDIVGDGPNRLEYEELSGKLGLTELVRFHGFRQKNEVARYMQECDFYVQPSLWETFGVVYVEAMACGKPVIASRVTGPMEIVNEDVGVLVPPKDVPALVAAINHMLDKHQNYSSERIAEYARERFGYEAVGKMLDDVYRDVLGEGTGQEGPAKAATSPPK